MVPSNGSATPLGGDFRGSGSVHGLYVDGKDVGLDFYKALTYLTDVLGLNIPKVCGIVSALLILIAPPRTGTSHCCV